MTIPRTVPLVLTWIGLTTTGGGVLFAASVLRPGGDMEVTAHPVVDLIQFVAAWAYILATPVVATSGLLLGRRHRGMASTNAAVLGIWLVMLVASLIFLHW
jgi:hypothetical protein